MKGCEIHGAWSRGTYLLQGLQCCTDNYEQSGIMMVLSKGVGMTKLQLPVAMCCNLGNWIKMDSGSKCMQMPKMRTVFWSLQVVFECQSCNRQKHVGCSVVRRCQFCRWHIRACKSCSTVRFVLDRSMLGALWCADAKDADDLVELVGDYTARSFYSRIWQLREAALLRMQKLLEVRPLTCARTLLLALSFVM